MKRKLLLATLLSVVVLCVTFHLHSRKKHMGDFLLENVEALAAGEMSQGYCVGNGSVDCPIVNVKVYFVGNDYSLESLH